MNRSLQGQYNQKSLRTNELHVNSSLSSLKIEWLNTTEAADFLRLSVKALRNLTSNGRLPFYKLGRRNRYRRDELEALLLRERRGEYGNQV